jgi:hypothetical protein
MLAGLATLFQHWARGQPLAGFVLPGLAAKWLAGVGIGLLYQFYYQGGDTLFLFEQGGHLANLLRNSPRAFWLFPHETPYKDLYYFGVFKDLTPRVLFFGKLTAIFHLLTGGNYWLCGAYFSLFSFLGLWLCANQLARIFRPRRPWGLAVAFFFFPSTVAWSAGLLKESLLWGFLGTATALGLRYVYPPPQARPRPWAWLGHGLGFAACLYGLFQLKFYYLAALLPSLVALGAGQFAQQATGSRTVGAGTFAIVFGGVLLLATLLHPSLHLDHLARSLVRNYEQMAEATDIDNLVYYPLVPTGAGLLACVPRALGAALFSPLPWDWHGNPLKLLVGLENLAVLGLLLYRLAQAWQYARAKRALTAGPWPLMLAALGYVGLLAVMLALATANLGTLLRYKNGFMPFLVALLWPLPKAASAQPVGKEQ